MKLDQREAAKVLRSELRSKILKTLVRSKTPLSPAALAKRFKEPVNLVAYHVHELEKLGAVALVSTRPRRGSTEHFYRAVFALKVERDGDVEMVIRGRRLVRIQPMTIRAIR